jgi:hypothetical protein
MSKEKRVGDGMEEDEEEAPLLHCLEGTFGDGDESEDSSPEPDEVLLASPDPDPAPGTSTAMPLKKVNNIEKGTISTPDVDMDAPTLITTTTPPPLPTLNTQGTSKYGSTSTGGESFSGKCFDATYLQCKQARAAGLLSNMYNTTFSAETMIRNSHRLERVGSLDNPEDSDLRKTFRGSRINSEGKNVNQNISLSFDPATMVCVCCPVPHSVLPKDGSGLSFLVGDQNFTSTLCGGTSCLPVIRVEDSTLDELVSICMEILDRQTIPAGTLFLISSISYLSRVGTTRYCSDWLSARDRVISRWRQAKMGPLPPIIRCDTPSTVGRQLMELVVWFDIVYNHLTEYPKDAWHILIKHIGTTDETGLDLMHQEKYTVAIPVSLTDRTLTNIWFSFSSSHTVTPGMDGTVTDELLRALVSVLDTDFACIANPEDIFLREPADRHSTMDTACKHTLVAIGGSNMGRLVQELRHIGFTIQDLSKPGWSPTPANIALVESELSKMQITEDNVALMDILANHAFRFEQEDGNLALPIKMGGTHHMLGTVRVCSKDTVQGTITKCKNILAKFTGTKVIIPPLPRHLFTSCCNDQGHCTDTGTQTHTHTLIESTLGLRKHIKDSLVKIGTKNFVVPDTLQKVVNENSDVVKMASELRGICADDGVHLTQTGYRKLADTVSKTVNECARPAAVIISGGDAAARTGFYWRGFVSPVGSLREPDHYKLSRQGGGKWRGSSRGRLHYSKSSTTHQLINRGHPPRAGRGRGYPPGGRFRN